MEFTKGEIDTIIFRNDLLNYFLQNSTSGKSKNSGNEIIA